MKRCYQCGESLPLEDFVRNASKADGKENYCRSCKKERRRRYSEKPGVRERVIVKLEQTQMERRRRTDEVKSSHPCQICGESDPCCLVFHHIDPSTKRGELGRLLSLARLEDEMKKCAVLCNNCHTKVHAGRFDGLALEKVNAA